MRPSWVRNVGYIAVDQAGTKYHNSTANVLAACDHDDISDPFLLFNDDFFVVAPVDTVPVLHNGPMQPAPRHLDGLSTWQQGRALTYRMLRQWGFDEPLSYDLHVPLPIHKAAMVEAVRRADRYQIPALHKRTVYGNVAGLGGVFADDVKVHDTGRTFPPGARFVSTNPTSWRVGLVGEVLRGVFEEPGPYEVREEGAGMSEQKIGVVAERTKALERLPDGRVVQRVFRAGQKIDVARARRLNVKLRGENKAASTEKAAPKKKAAAKTDAGKATEGKEG